MTDAAVARFRDALNALVPPPARIGIAVSGGPDSMALLFLAHRAFGSAVEAATVDHGLRAASAEEAAMVGAWCAAQGIPHVVLHPETPITGNIQSAARAVRYRLLEGWRGARGLAAVATAHHADDQLETLLMRLNRGSGLNGMAGIRARNGHVVRPLLGWGRAELRALAEGAALPFVDDPSNVDPRYDRASLRARLAQADWLDAGAAQRSAAALAEAQAALDWAVDGLAEQAIRNEGDVWRLDPPDAPRDIRRRLLIALIARAAPDMPPPRGDALVGVLARVEAGGKASLGDWLIAGGAVWTLRPAPPRSVQPLRPAPPPTPAPARRR